MFPSLPAESGACVIIGVSPRRIIPGGIRLATRPGSSPAVDHAWFVARVPVLALPTRPQGMVITLTSVPGIPMVRPGDALAALLVAACERKALAPADGDILVVAQKIVSKAEGR